MTTTISKPRILVLKIKNFCYDSSFYFADRVAYYFKNMGWDVDVFDSAKRPLTDLDEYSGRHYDAIVDFNSILPKADTDEGGYYLDTIDGPFYNYILDHPVFHHETLVKKLRNHNVICLDLNHKAYLEKWYPNLKNVYFLPVAGSRSEKYKYEYDPENENGFEMYAKRPYELLFMGTYTDPDAVFGSINKFDGSLKKEMLYLIEHMLQDPRLTMEAALDGLLKERGLDERLVQYPVRMHTYFPVDMYIRSRIREDVMTALADSGLPLTIVGHGWDKCRSLRDKKNVRLLPPVPFKESFDYMAQAKICVNSNPLFTAGCHDRVFSAMLNGAAALTESSSYVENEFDASADLMTYDRTDAESLKEMTASALKNIERLYEMSLRGKDKASVHDWEHHCFKMSGIFRENR